MSDNKTFKYVETAVVAFCGATFSYIGGGSLIWAALGSSFGEVLGVHVLNFFGVEDVLKNPKNAKLAKIFNISILVIHLFAISYFIYYFFASDYLTKILDSVSVEKGIATDSDINKGSPLISDESVKLALSLLFGGTFFILVKLTISKIIQLIK